MSDEIKFLIILAILTALGFNVLHNPTDENFALLAALSLLILGISTRL